MEITGKIIAALPMQSGLSQRNGNMWASQEYVLITNERYPKKCCFRLASEDKIKYYNLQIGDEIKVYLDIDASEYNGKWYNRITAWKIEKDGLVEAHRPVSQPLNPTIQEDALPIKPLPPTPPLSDLPFDNLGSTDDFPF